MSAESRGERRENPKKEKLRGVEGLHACTVIGVRVDRVDTDGVDAKLERDIDVSGQLQEHKKKKEKIGRS
jgi:hypothetical protein